MDAKMGPNETWYVDDDPGCFDQMLPYQAKTAAQLVACYWQATQLLLNIYDGLDAADGWPTDADMLAEYRADRSNLLAWQQALTRTHQALPYVQRWLARAC